MGTKNMSPSTRTFSNPFLRCLDIDYARTFLLFFVPSMLCYVFFFAPLKRPYGLVEQRAEGMTLPQQGTQVFGEESLNKRHMAAVKKGCGDICEIDMEGVPSLFHNYIEKKVDCLSLLSNPAIDAVMTDAEPPDGIPEDMLGAFTYNGKVSVRPSSYGVLNQRYLGKEALVSTWTKKMIDNMAEQCAQGKLEGNYGQKTTNALVEGLKQMHLKGASVVVIGSENPWVEACILSLGAAKVTTIEYGSINSTHPQVQTLTPRQVRLSPELYLDKFDSVVTFSSVEHSGLGRYGDALNPWGDRQAVARAWCMTKPKGWLALGVMYDDNNDIIEYNAHRMYGSIQLPHLLANWKQIWRSDVFDQQRTWVCQKSIGRSQALVPSLNLPKENETV